ncbi:MAG: TRAM domain-containing protein [Spirochaetes bacterium]|nr:TRAM domain-containing protein [Spirochaetota bacterium]
MKPGDILDLTIDSIASGGDGVGRFEGCTVFVPASAPGDRLRVQISETRSSYARAEISGILEASSQRAETAFCPLLAQCGGCNLGHLDYGCQLAIKQGILEAALRRNQALPPQSVQLHASVPLGYRHRAQFRPGASGRPAYSVAGSNTLVEPSACPILATSLDGWLRSAVSADLPGLDRFSVFSPGDAVYVEGRDGSFDFEFYGHRFRMDPSRFFQSNLGLLPELVELVCTGFSGKRAADLYCGVGLFASWLKDSFASLHCVELDSAAVRLAAHNVGPSASYAACSLDDWVALPAAAQPFDYVLVDPPRAGLSSGLRRWLAEKGPPILSYVSCDVQSLARDLGQLRSSYEVAEVHLFDFYPQTSHIESCARLLRRVDS